MVLVKGRGLGRWIVGMVALAIAAGWMMGILPSSGKDTVARAQGPATTANAAQLERMAQQQAMQLHVLQSARKKLEDDLAGKEAALVDYRTAHGLSFAPRQEAQERSRLEILDAELEQVWAQTSSARSRLGTFRSADGKSPPPMPPEIVARVETDPRVIALEQEKCALERDLAAAQVADLKPGNLAQTQARLDKAVAQLLAIRTRLAETLRAADLAAAQFALQELEARSRDIQERHDRCDRDNIDLARAWLEYEGRAERLQVLRSALRDVDTRLLYMQLDIAPPPATSPK